MDGIYQRVIAYMAVAVTVVLVGSGRAAEPDSMPKAEQPAAEEIAAWIKELDDSRYQVREAATQQLLLAGDATLDPLLAVANGDRPEPADRSIWILRRLGRSRDNSLALAALERLVQLEDRPAIVSKAQADLTDRSVIACEERLGPLGAEMASQVDGLQATFFPLLVIRLGEKWRGTVDDLRELTKLKEVRHFRLEGGPITDEVVLLFAKKEKLDYLQLFDTKVTPAAVDAVKAKHPDAVVYVRNSAMLGVAAESHQDGVRVNVVVQGTGAAIAGIVAGDIITTIDGHAIPDFDRLTARIAQRRPGEKVEVEIIRDGTRMKMEPILGSRPEVE